MKETKYNLEKSPNYEYILGEKLEGEKCSSCYYYDTKEDEK